MNVCPPPCLSMQGTTVIPLLTSVLLDSSEWESPHTFNPYHFLDAEGRLIKRKAFMPFSAGMLRLLVTVQPTLLQGDPPPPCSFSNSFSGQRACLGESLARMEVFLFLASLLQHFRFTPPPGVTEDELDLTPLVGFTLSPRPHQLCAISRL